VADLNLTSQKIRTSFVSFSSLILARKSKLEDSGAFEAKEAETDKRSKPVVDPEDQDFDITENFIRK
jgi:hypothetical protein